MDSTDLFILKMIDSGEPHATGLAAEQLGLSRQSIAARLRRLTEQKLISPTGIGRGRRYRLLPATSLHKAYAREALDEFRVWQTDIVPLLAGLPENVIDIWRYGITEMVNNAVDHSEGLEVIVRVERTALRTTVSVIDNGEGIFHRIQRLLGLYKHVRTCAVVGHLASQINGVSVDHGLGHAGADFMAGDGHGLLSR